MNFSKLTFPLLGIILLLFSCNNEETITSPDETNSIQLINLNVPNTTTSAKLSLPSSNKILSFPSFEAYEKTITNLEKEIELHEDQFVAKYDHLSEDDLNNIEEKTGFDTQLPLVKFENKMGISNSLRTYHNEAEEKWLQNEDLDLALDPSNEIPFGKIEQSLWNRDFEIKIGNSIFKLTSDGKSYEITGDYENALSKIRQGFDTSKDSNIITHTNTSSQKSSALCRTWRASTDYVQYASNRLVIRQVLIRSVPFFCKTKAKIISYKKRRRRWKRRRTHIGVALQTRLRTSCSGSIARQEYKSKSIKKRRSRTVRQHHWGFAPSLRTKNGETYGIYWYGGTNSSKALTW